MNIVTLIWGWIVAHWPDIVKGVTDAKLFADAGASIKKLAPEKLSVKEEAQAYMAQTAAILDDEHLSFEEKQFEVDARRGFVQDMIQLTVIEAAYNILRYAIFSAFAAYMYNVILRLLTSSMSRRHDDKRI